MWIPELKEAWRYSSVKASAAGAAIMAFFAIDPMALLDLLNALPLGLSYLFPERALAIFSAVIFCITLYFRLKPQPKTERKIRAKLKSKARK